MGKLQNEDFKTETELVNAGGAKSQLLNDSKIYVTANAINKTLDDAITDGDIGAGGSGEPTHKGAINLFADYSSETADAGDFTDSTNMTTSITSTGANVGRGLQAFQFTATAGSETAESASLAVPLGYRENGKIFFNFLAQCGADFTIRLLDKTNATTLIEEIISNNSSIYEFYQFAADFPASMLNCAWEVESSASQTFYMDDVFIGFEGSLQTISIQDVAPLLATLSSQSLTTATNTTLAVNTIESDDDLLLDTGIGRVTFKKSGFYLVQGRAQWQNNATGLRRFRIRTSINAAVTFPDTSEQIAESSGNTFQRVQCLKYFSTGDTVELQGSQESGGNLNCQNIRFEINKIDTTPEILVTEADNVAPARVDAVDTTVIATSTVTYLSFTSTDYDNDVQFTNVGATNTTTRANATTWTCPKTGYYKPMLKTRVVDVDLDINEVIQVRLEVDGVVKLRDAFTLQGSATTTNLSLSVSDVIYLVKGQELNASIFHSAGADVSFDSGDIDNWFSVYRIDKSPVIGLNETKQTMKLIDGVTAPGTESYAQIYIDSSDGDLKIKFADGTVKTIVTDT